MFNNLFIEDRVNVIMKLKQQNSSRCWVEWCGFSDVAYFSKFKIYQNHLSSLLVKSLPLLNLTYFFSSRQIQWNGTDLPLLNSRQLLCHNLPKAALVSIFQISLKSQCFSVTALWNKTSASGFLDASVNYPYLDVFWLELCAVPIISYISCAKPSTNIIKLLSEKDKILSKLTLPISHQNCINYF